MPRADWNVLKKYSLPKPSDGLLAVFNDTVRPITAQCLLADISARDSRIGPYGISTAYRPHSALMLAARITLPHFSVSSAMCLPKSAGEPGSTVPPRSARRAFSLGSTRPALISLLSLSIICGGVFLGAPTPNQVLAS